MDNTLQLFESREFGKLRVIEIDGQPWFVGKDVTDVLGYSNSTKALKDHVDADDLTYRYPIVDSLGRTQAATLINESGLFSLILSSKLPQAKAFKRWVTTEILPSIRRHGAYITKETLNQMLHSNEFVSELLNRLSGEQERTAMLKEHIAELAPKARYYDVILQSKNAVQVSLIAKDYGMSAAAFNQLLHDMRIQYKVGNTWLLYQQYASKGYTKSRTYQINEQVTAVHTYWNQKGRLFLYEFLKEQGIVPLMEAMDACGF